MSTSTRLSRPARIIPAALAAPLAGLLATSAWLWWSGSGESEIDPSATAVARQQVVNFFSLDHRHIDDDVDRVLALATGKFKQQYAKQRDRVEQGVGKQKLVVTAKVPDNGAALEYQHGDRARVLVAVDATTTGEAKTKPKTNRYRVRLALLRVDGRWLVSEINQAG